MFVAFFECIAVVWIYGFKRLSKNVQDMTGRLPNLFFKICWPVLSPLIILVSLFLINLMIIIKNYLLLHSRMHILLMTQKLPVYV